MPVLTKPAWELVAQALANGATKKDAYSAGGYRYTSTGANKLCNRPEMKVRVAEILAEREEQAVQARKVAAQKTGIDRAWIEKALANVYTSAMRGDPVRDREGRKRRDPETGEVITKPDRMAAGFAARELGRMHGVFIDRTEIGKPGDFAALTDTELEVQIIETARAAGVPERALKLLEFVPKKEAAE